MYLKLAILVLFIIQGYFLNAQTCYDYIAKKEIKLKNGSDTKQLIENTNCFLEKGLDSLDLKIILHEQLFNYFFHEAFEEGVPFTYERLFLKYSEYKTSTNYEKMRALIELENRSFEYKNWKEDKNLLKKLDITNSELQEFHLYIQKYSDSSKTYKTAFVEFHEMNEKIQKKRYNDLYSKYKDINLDLLLSQSLAENKPIILYFANSRSVNCRKIEQNVLNEPQIYPILLEEFIFVPLFTDDGTALKKENWFTSTHNGNIIKTVGAKNLNYLETNFNLSETPYFVVIDSDGAILETSDYSKNSVSEYYLFLESCVEKRMK